MEIMMAKRSEQEFCVKLVEAVEKYPCLYNYKLSEYSRKDITEKQWCNVAQEVNEEVITCKEKWKNIRTVFVRNLKPAPSGSSAKAKKPYYLMDKLQFILPFVKIQNGDIQGNLQSTTSNSQNTDNEGEEDGELGHEIQHGRNIENDSQQVKSSCNETEAGTSQRRCQKRKSELSEVDRTFVEFCKSKIEKKVVIPDNPNKMFLMSLLPDMDEMNIQQVRQFKRTVLELIDDIFNTDQRPTSAQSLISSMTSQSAPTPLQSPIFNPQQFRCNENSGETTSWLMLP